MFKRILVAIDGSATSDRALNVAMQLALDQHAKLHILHILDDLTIAPSVDGGLFRADYFELMIGSLRKAGVKLVEDAQKRARERGIEATGRFVESLGQSVPDAILAEARAAEADMIVMGTHGRRGLRRTLLGSDAESVLRESPVPLLMVRTPEAQW